MEPRETENDMEVDAAAEITSTNVLDEKEANQDIEQLKTKKDVSLLNLTIKDLITVQIVEEAKIRLIRWVNTQVIAVVVVVIVLGYFGIKQQMNVLERAIKASEAVEKALPLLSNFAQITDSLTKRFVEIDTRVGTSRSELERLKGEILILQKDFENNRTALNYLLTDAAKTNQQLKNTLKNYEKESMVLDQRKAQFRENQRFTIIIQHNSDTKQRALACKDLLVSYGFQVELKELNQAVSAIYRQRGFDEQVHYFDEAQSEKVKEVAEQLKIVANFTIRKQESSEKDDASFFVWVLR